MIIDKLYYPDKPRKEESSVYAALQVFGDFPGVITAEGYGLRLNLTFDSLIRLRMGNHTPGGVFRQDSF